MSNARAIATVTATLRSICQAVANDAVPEVRVTTERPAAREETKHTAGLNVFLYRASVNSTFRNHDTPTRDSRGRLVKTPATGFDLDYLFTFYGPSTQSQMLLGHVVAALHAEPYLTPRRITKAIEEESDPDANSPILLADLADQQERLRLTPIPLDLEEIAKLWSVFLQVPYDLSIAYRVSVVLISADLSPGAPLPVRSGGASSAPGMPPQIEQVTPQILDVPQSGPMLIRGKHLSGDLEVQFGNLAPVPAGPTTAAGELSVDLPTGLVAGITPVHVILKIPTPTGPQKLASNEVVVVVRPAIKTKSIKYHKASDAVTFQVSPVTAGQHGTLLLNQVTDTTDPQAPVPHAAAIDFQLADDSGGVSVTGITSSRHKVPPGTYLLRVRIDGGESELEFGATTDATGNTIEKYTGPLVEIT